jgi:hypothetical protein
MLTPQTYPKFPNVPDQANDPSMLGQVSGEMERRHSYSRLAGYILDSFNRARYSRTATGYDSELVDDMRAIRCEYSSEDRMLFDDENPIYFPLTLTKCKAGQAWFRDILTTNLDSPFTIEPTPEPRLPMDAKLAVVKALRAQLQELVMSGQPLPSKPALNDNAKSLLKKAREYIDRQAKSFAAAAEKRIVDQMLDGNWRATLNECIGDFFTFPMAIMYGPSPMQKEKLSWSKQGRLEKIKVDCYEYQRVSPFDFYWTSDSKCPQSGTGVFWRRRATVKDLWGMIGCDGAIEENIRIAISRFEENGYRDWWLSDSERDNLENKAHAFVSGMHEIDIVMYAGRAQGSMLQGIGIEVEDDEKPYEVEVWQVADLILLARINPHLMGSRPFHTGCFNPIPGSMFGRSLPKIIEPCQRAINSDYRALMRNKAFASGPMGGINRDRIHEDESDVTSWQPYRLWQLKDSQFGQANSAIEFYRVPSIIGELIGSIDHNLRVADDVSRIPAYVNGQVGSVGTVGRTLGGISLLMGAAAKGMKEMVNFFDTGIIEPAVKMHYEFLLMFDPDKSIKGDAQVKARASSGLINRELSQGSIGEVLATLAQMPPGVVPATGIQALLREMLKARGYDAEALIPEKSQEQLQQEMMMAMMSGGQMPKGGSPEVGPSSPTLPAPQVTQQAPLDGRSLKQMGGTQ